MGSSMPGWAAHGRARQDERPRATEAYRDPEVYARRVVSTKAPPPTEIGLEKRVRRYLDGALTQHPALKSAWRAGVSAGVDHAQWPQGPEPVNPYEGGSAVFRAFWSYGYREAMAVVAAMAEFNVLDRP